MNTIITSKEEILSRSRDLIRHKGLSAINIRSVASACGVSVGSIYYYFDSKTDLMSGAIESVWRDIFDMPKGSDSFADTQECILWIYEKMKSGDEKYPGFFTFHSMGFMEGEKSDGKKIMHDFWYHITSGICSVLKRDAKIRPQAFNEIFTPEKFADIILALILSSVMKNNWDSYPIMEIVKRTLY